MTDPLVTEKPIITCPMPGCDFTLERPKPVDPLLAGAISLAMGAPQGAVAGIHDHQNKRRAEFELQAHMRSHDPTEWAVALQVARDGLRMWTGLQFDLGVCPECGKPVSYFVEDGVRPHRDCQYPST